jgi:hypothetical protein
MGIVHDEHRTTEFDCSARCARCAWIAPLERAHFVVARGRKACPLLLLSAARDAIPPDAASRSSSAALTNSRW